MSEETELTIDPAVFEEILHNTDKKNFINMHERILRKTMVELVKSGFATFLFIRDDESREWWGKTVKQAADIVEKRREAWRVYEVKKAAWDRLSESDRKALGIRKPAQPKYRKVN